MSKKIEVVLTCNIGDQDRIDHGLEEVAAMEGDVVKMEDKDAAKFVANGWAVESTKEAKAK